jgi:16S rRNA (uracil1498-N3)-methyltransferase
MTRRRWIADEVSGNLAALTGSHAQHLSRVLRVRVGQTFDIATTEGVRAGIVTAIHDSRVEFELGEAVIEQPAVAITLALAIFKFDRMEWAIEKCTELGVTRIIPIVAQRSEPHLATAATKRVERWRRIAIQASEQSRRASPPEIVEPVKVKELIQFPAGNRVLLSETEHGIMLRDAVPEHSGDILLAVGPEGGWTAAEIELFSSEGWTAASLGNTILRAETAAIAAVAVVLSELQYS